jgi:dTDP-4-dehydrorhamnose 3,5-epimerase
MKHGNFTFSTTPAFNDNSMKGPLVITSKGFEDSRGVFYETYNREAFHAAGILDVFCQDNQSFSHKGVLRGLHYQTPNYQSKLVKVVSGRVYDVAVDIRPDSPNYGVAVGIELKPDGTMFYIPEGFAHGFLALEPSVFSYKCGNLYDPKGDNTLKYDAVDIPWEKIAKPYGIEEFIISEKDLKGIPLPDRS